MNENVVIITGASAGLGKATKEFLEEKGYIVYGTSRRGKALDEVMKYDGHVNRPLVQLDLNSTADMKTFIQAIQTEHDRIDVLINNAGYGLAGPITKTPLEEIRDQWQVNFFASHTLIQGVLPIMLKQDKGYIINIGSIAGRIPLPFQPFYSASKAALDKYTQALAMQLKGTNVKAVLIEPGRFKTKFQEHMRYVTGKKRSKARGADPKKMARLIHKIIRSRKPRTRYVLGWDAKVFAFADQFLPNRVKHYLIVKATMPRKKFPYI